MARVRSGHHAGACWDVMSRIHPLAPADPAPVAATDPATNTFSVSMVVSGVRCLLTYVVFPWALPLFGLAGGVGPALGLSIGLVAIGFNVASIRRFWVAGHRWRIPITVINVSVIVLLSILVGMDISDLAG